MSSNKARDPEFWSAAEKKVKRHELLILSNRKEIRSIFVDEGYVKTAITAFKLQFGQGVNGEFPPWIEEYRDNFNIVDVFNRSFYKIIADH